MIVMEDAAPITTLLLRSASSSNLPKSSEQVSVLLVFSGNYRNTAPTEPLLEPLMELNTNDCLTHKLPNYVVT
jgi:hypothetical protein